MSEEQVIRDDQMQAIQMRAGINHRAIALAESVILESAKAFLAKGYNTPFDNKVTVEAAFALADEYRKTASAKVMEYNHLSVVEVLGEQSQIIMPN